MDPVKCILFAAARQAAAGGDDGVPVCRGCRGWGVALLYWEPNKVATIWWTSFSGFMLSLLSRMPFCKQMLSGGV